MSSITISFTGIEEIEIQTLHSELAQLIETENMITVSGNSFNGINDIVLIITSLGGAGGIVYQISKVLVHWINFKRSRKVKINGIEITGYSAEDVAKILKVNSGE